MKVLLIDVNCKNSSTGNIVYNLYNYINSSGNEAAICYGRGPLIKEKNIFKFSFDLETYLHAVLTRITGFTGCFSFFSTRRLIKFIEKFQPDVVHIHELHAYFVNIKPLINYLKDRHIKTIMTLHCEFAYTGKCGHSVECDQWKIECKKCPHLREYVSTMWYDHTNYMFKQKKKYFSNFDELIIISPSEWLANRIKQSFLKEYPVKIIHNGIDTNIFRTKNVEYLRKQLGINLNEKVILALAPHLMSKEKGGIFIKKIANLLENKRIRFIMIGIDDIEQNYYNNLIMCGPIYNKDILADYYSLADLFLICSERENFPTTCIEAQCCGTTVCGFDTGGTKETVIYKAKDSLVEYGKVEKLIEVICERLNNLPSKMKISQLAIKEYSNKYMCEQYFKIYQNN